MVIDAPRELCVEAEAAKNRFIVAAGVPAISVRLQKPVIRARQGEY